MSMTYRTLSEWAALIGEDMMSIDEAQKIFDEMELEPLAPIVSDLPEATWRHYLENGYMNDRSSPSPNRPAPPEVDAKAPPSATASGR